MEREKYFWKDKSFTTAFEYEFKSKCADDKRLEFVSQMLSENLNHARHIESERLTYCTCITALIAGYLAFLSSAKLSPIVALIFCVVIHMATAFSFRLNERWTYSFNRHMVYAKGCYNLLYQHMFNAPGFFYSTKGNSGNESFLDRLTNYFVLDEQSVEYAENAAYKENFELDGIDTDIPYQMYAFGINSTILSKVCVDKISTKYYFRVYYIALYLVISLALLGAVYKVNPEFENPIQIIVLTYMAVITFIIYLRPFFIWLLQKIWKNDWMHIHDIISIPLVYVVFVVIASVIVAAIIEIPDIIDVYKNGNIDFGNIFVDLMNDWFGGVENANQTGCFGLR